MVILRSQFCTIKKVIIIALFIAAFQTGLFSSNIDGMCLVAITDNNNERIAGASVELVGTNKVFYSNINGYCYIPKYLLSRADKVTINSISYKTVQLNPEDLSAKVILKSR